MRREYPENVRNLLSSWEAEKTVRFVESRGISSRNWRMFCLESGVVDGRKWKQREIAVEYKMTIARVSSILRTIMARLSGTEKDRTILGLTREYRAGRYRILKENQIVNATKVGALTSLFRRTSSCATTESIEFVADGKQCRVKSVGRLGRKVRWEHSEELVQLFCLKKMFGRQRRGLARYFQGFFDDSRLILAGQPHFFDRKIVDSPGFVVLWTEVDVGKVGNKVCEISCSRGANGDSFLVFDCGGAFWVVDKFDFHTKEKRLIVRLKPAEYAHSEAKGGQKS